MSEMYKSLICSNFLYISGVVKDRIAAWGEGVTKYLSVNSAYIT